MKIDELYIKVRELSYQDRAVQVATTVSQGLRDALRDFAETKKMTMRQALDMSIYNFLSTNGHEFADFSVPNKTEKKKNIIRACAGCYIPYNITENKTCPKCGNEKVRQE